MRMSDWSSDVCSSDLAHQSGPDVDDHRPVHGQAGRQPQEGDGLTHRREFFPMKSLLSLLTIGLLAMALYTTDADAQPAPENVLVMELKDGIVRIELLPELAPQHVERIKTLARQGFYDGIVFHRVIDGFMADRKSTRLNSSH